MNLVTHKLTNLSSSCILLYLYLSQVATRQNYCWFEQWPLIQSINAPPLCLSHTHTHTHLTCIGCQFAFTISRIRSRDYAWDAACSAERNSCCYCCSCDRRRAVTTCSSLSLSSSQTVASLYVDWFVALKISTCYCLMHSSWSIVLWSRSEHTRSAPLIEGRQ